MLSFTKATGWLLLFLGLAVIFYSLYSSYQIFAGKVEAPKIFVLTAQTQKSAAASSGAGKLFGGLTGIDVEKVLGGEIQKILPAGYLPQLLNLLAWSTFAGILIFAGSQIASLGIKLMV